MGYNREESYLINIMLTTVNILEILFGVILIGSVLLQVRGSGFSSVFGGSGGEYFREKRGLQKFLYYETIIVSIVFVALSIVLLILTK